jgi:hypothetical protein
MAAVLGARYAEYINTLTAMCIICDAQLNIGTGHVHHTCPRAVPMESGVWFTGDHSCVKNIGIFFRWPVGIVFCVWLCVGTPD